MAVMKKKPIYCDPNGRFSVILVAWGCGAKTPIHGHHAWGCLSVVSGEITFNCYKVVGDCDCPAVEVKLSEQIQASAGAVATGDVYPKGIHALENHTQSPAVTLHVYGMDVSQEPDNLNIFINTLH